MLDKSYFKTKILNFSHLSMIWRTISQVRAELCRIAEDSWREYIVQKLLIYRVEEMEL